MHSPRQSDYTYADGTGAKDSQLADRTSAKDSYLDDRWLNSTAITQADSSATLVLSRTIMATDQTETAMSLTQDHQGTMGTMFHLQIMCNGSGNQRMAEMIQQAPDNWPHGEGFVFE